jgi:hypothetical protein
MVGWPWLLAAVLGVTLLQVLLYRRLRGDADRAGRTGDQHGRADRSGRTEDQRGRDEGHSVTRRSAFGMGGAAAFAAGNDREDTPDDADGRSCPHCGARNEPDDVFTYCAECVRPLP